MTATYVPPVDQPPAQAVTTTPYGGFWVRFAAYMVDGVLIGLASIAVALVWAAAFGIQATTDSNLLSLLLLAGGQLYHAYFVSSEKMATPGKRWCGLYVTDLEGKRLGFGRALWRNVAALFSYLTLYIGFIMAGFTERKQALHDKIAGTLVHRQPGSSAGVVVAIVLMFFVGIFVLGILAAIAIPAYQDYVFRAKTSGVLAAMSSQKEPIVAYEAQTGQWPGSWEQLEAAGGGDPTTQLDANSRSVVSAIRLEEGGVVVADLTLPRKNRQLRLVPAKTGDSVTWSCVADVDIRKYTPAACRQ